MRRVVVLAAAVLLAAAPAAAQDHGDHGDHRGAGTAVAIQFAAFSPPAVDVLAGDTITWANASVRRHDVAALDRSWDSGTLFSGDRYAHGFETPGSVAYYCTLHPFMRGTVGVHELLLAAPHEPGAPGRPFTLHGRSALPAGTPIAIEADEGTGFRPLAKTGSEPDGSFIASVRPRASSKLRAVAGDAASPAVQLLVIDRTVAATARTRRGRALVGTQVLPAAAGATVVLQLRLRERFGWWPVRRAKLDGRSRARFRVRVRRPVRARVVLTLSDGATPLAVSRTLHVGSPHH